MIKSKPRLFVALWPDTEVRKAISDVVGGLSEPGLNSARPVKSEYIHMTLAFLGNVQAEKLQAIVNELGKVEIPIFDVVLDYRLYHHRSHMLWLTPRHPPKQLLALAKSISAHLEICGFKPERRPFSPHVTVARKIKIKMTCNPVSAIPWRVSSFCLVESEPGEGGSRYFVRETWPASRNQKPDIW